MYYNGDDAVQAEYLYVYSADGQLAKQYAVSGGNVVEEYSFEYDSLGRLIRSREDKGSSNVQRTEHLYDTANRLTKQSWTIGGKAFTESYTYNSGDGSLNTFTTALYGHTQTFAYDSLKRVSRASIKNPSGTELFYTVNNYAAHTGNANRTTNRVSSFSYRKTNTDLIAGNSYTYDAVGNITRITDLGTNKTVAAYEYDAQGQLTKETQYNANGVVQDSYRYVYDTAGNLMQINTGDNSFCIVSYDYDNSNWQDLLTGYDDHPIYYEGQKTASGSYSASTKPLSGNPITWYNGSSYTDLTWAQGRRLMSLKKGSTAVSYTYDMEGIRSSKIVDGVTHHYVTQNGKIVRESYDNIILDFIYDANGNPFALSFSKNGGNSFSAFYYLLNAQGDVIGLINGSGELVVSYTYDAWGNILSMENYILSPNNKDLHEVNPLRYRGYYYDNETGWYYLQSRYYDPAVGRFINPDGNASTGQEFLGYNMFVYCGNSPITRLDSCGNEWEPVGGGLQVQGSFDLNGVSFCAGIEAVIYWGTEEVEECGGPVIAFYTYEGASISSEQINCMKDLLFNCVDLATMDGANALQILAASPSLSGSVSAFIIMGNDNFTDSSSYKGRFDTWTVNLKNAQGFYSYSSTSKVVGLGYCGSTNIGGSKWGVSKSTSQYQLIATIPIPLKKKASPLPRISSGQFLPKTRATHSWERAY